MGLAIPTSLPDDAAKPAKRRRIAPKRKIKFRPLEARILDALSQPDRVLFLDIETTGLSRHYDEVTLVGWMLGGAYDVLISGDEPAPLLAALNDASALVTFNGTLFDLPFLRKTFPDLPVPAVHADLRYLARRASLTGGQKAIERAIGIRVRQGIEELDGAHAVLLWHRYLRGNTGALRTLIDYNHADVLGMRYILDEVVDRLVETVVS